jgi:cysteine-rich repeat protein
MARSWRMLSTLLLLSAFGTHCTEDESDGGDTGGRDGSGGLAPEGGTGGEAQSSGGTVPLGGTDDAGEGGAPPGGSGNLTGGSQPGGAGNGGAGGAGEVIPAGEAGASSCWECAPGRPCSHLQCGNGTVEQGCFIPFECFQASPAGGVSGPYHFEQCDDGNQDDGDGCSRRCLIEYELFCGNGRVDDHEDCDDGNREAQDGCDERCRGRYDWHCDTPGEPCVKDVCGNGRSGFGLCDDGNTESGDGCSETCDVELNWTCPPEGACEEAHCGNGSLDQYSEDDEDGFAGAWNVGGQLIRREDCDDGNQISGDGCTSRCATEEGWDCGLFDGSCHRPDCGDGYLFPPEQCDDGNDQPGDGCDDSCEIELGWICRQPLAGDNGAGGAGGAVGSQPPTREGPSTCIPSACGDGVVREDEQCDDGNTASGDGCSNACEVEGEACTELTP